MDDNSHYYSLLVATVPLTPSRKNPPRIDVRIELTRRYGGADSVLYNFG